MAEYDLTQKIIPFLDRHLAFPLLDHLSEAGIFPEEQLWEAQYQLAAGTNMIDYAQEIFKKLHPTESEPESSHIISYLLRIAQYLCRLF
jgi:translation initiation factor 3 subunit E